ncbi:MAG: RiPP maturation radical SAM C-methyltransferase [Thermodesulfobacteriota bacterium]
MTMQLSKQVRPKKIGLFSTPWPLYNRPSIQLGALQAYLRQQFPELQVISHHFYLQLAAALGYRTYQEISRKSWQAESVYAALLYPERTAILKKLFYKEAGSAPGKPIDFHSLVSAVKTASDDLIGKIDWNAFGLAGFSICFCQLTSALYFIRQIKRSHPTLPVVVGGSLVSGINPEEFFPAFPEIDFLIRGEGENPIGRLVQTILKDGVFPDTTGNPGLLSRNTRPSEFHPAFDQVDQLDGLPLPIYDDYFRLLASFPPGLRFFPNLPVEISRGCWWAAGQEKRGQRGCAFCNLNLQWQGYRHKSPSVVVRQIDALTSRHQSLSVSIVDNVLPMKQAATIFSKLTGLGKDLDLFCELRAAVPPAVLAAMRRAGVRTVQIGIEALSSRLLRKMNKGATTIQNIETMKNCEELGIVNSSNLILHFPGSDEEDVAETLRCLEFVLPFRPLKAIEFRLGSGSPVMNGAKQYGIKATYNHPHYRLLLPPETSDRVQWIHRAYRGDLLHQKKLWKEVKLRIAAWQADYAALRRDSDQGPILGYQDGRDFLIIRQKRPGKEPLIHRLKGRSREIYLFCRRRRKVGNILAHWKDVPADKLLSFLAMMVEKRLMFEEKGVYLSLASALAASQTFSIPLQSPYE